MEIRWCKGFVCRRQGGRFWPCLQIDRHSVQTPILLGANGRAEPAGVGFCAQWVVTQGLVEGVRKSQGRRLSAEESVGTRTRKQALLLETN